MNPRIEEIIKQADSDPNENPWVNGKPKEEIIAVEEYRNDWPEIYKEFERKIQGVLGSLVLHLEHVGSTAVPSLAAKPVIDIDLILSEPKKEELYVPLLEKLGFVLTVRENSWYQHRCLRLESPRVNLHVFPPDCPEFIRHIMFRDWLIQNAEDRKLYQEAKLSAQVGVSNASDYNSKKNDVVKDIYNRLFKAAGFLT